MVFVLRVNGGLIMRSIYKRLICSFVFAAFVWIGAVSAGAERSTADTAFDAAILAEDGDKAQMDEQDGSGKQIFVCIGGGVVVIVGIICLLADNKKK